MSPREELVEPLRRVLRWMLALRDGDGRIVCPDHRIEHTGKSAGAIVLACALARRDGERDALLTAAVGQAERLAGNLEREGVSTCFTFRPGRHDPYNCSNNVIDGGACSDALAELVTTFGERLTAEQRERFTRAAVLHAQTYLRYAVVDKAIPAQKAWAMTGVAGAYALSRHEVLELTVREGAKRLAAAQRGDGSYPYHPLDARPGHPGASDASAYYQSRVTAFLCFALERAGLDPRDAAHQLPLLRGLDFLLGLQGPDGLKCGLVEAKPWYWGATHEVASHPFDVFALARGWRLFGHGRYADGAARAWRAWVERLRSDGRPRDHLPAPGRRRSYQCPLFWAAHASWLARALDDLEAILARPADAAAGAGTELSVAVFPDTALVRLEDDRVAAWVRGARPGANALHGSPRGAGLLRAVSKASGEELLARERRDDLEGEWCARRGVFSPGRGWRSGGAELRFSLWLARNAWRGRRPGEALAWPPRTLARAVLTPGSGRLDSTSDLAPALSVLPDGVELESRLAWRDGTPLAGSALLRTFRVDGGGLVVEERVQAAGGARGLAYRLPARAREVERSAERVRYRLG